MALVKKETLERKTSFFCIVRDYMFRAVYLITDQEDKQV